MSEVAKDMNIRMPLNCDELQEEKQLLKKIVILFQLVRRFSKRIVNMDRVIVLLLAACTVTVGANGAFGPGKQNSSKNQILH